MAAASTTRKRVLLRCKSSRYPGIAPVYALPDTFFVSDSCARIDQCFLSGYDGGIGCHPDKLLSDSDHEPMRRWILIMLLVVYPFQVALAVADRCCVTTPAGVTHHVAAGQDAFAAQPAFVVDDGVSLLADPHCAACTLGHSVGLPSGTPAFPGSERQSGAAVAATAILAPPPPARPERPKWPAALD